MIPMSHPAPYPADTRAKGWRFELDLEQISQSDTWALAPQDVRPWLLMLWSVSWQQTPCGSLPGEDAIIAARIGMKPAAFAKHKAVLLRGWELADDGRLYHPAMTKRVLTAIEANRIKCAALRQLHDKDAYRRFRDLVLQRDGEICHYCDATDVPLQLDHVFPRSRGGKDHPDNLVPACRKCNASKGARTPEEWMGAA